MRIVRDGEKAQNIYVGRATQNRKKTHHRDPSDLVVHLDWVVVQSAIRRVVRPEEAIPNDDAGGGFAVHDQGRPPGDQSRRAHLRFQRQGGVEEARRRCEFHSVPAHQGHGRVGVVLVDHGQIASGVEFEVLHGDHLDYRVGGRRRRRRRRLEGSHRLLRRRCDDDGGGGVVGRGGVGGGSGRGGQCDARLREAEATADARVEGYVVIVARLVEGYDEGDLGGGARAHRGGGGGGGIRRIVLGVAGPRY